jgi:hypothetical protein
MAVKKKKLSPKKTVDSSAVRTDPVGQRGRSDVAEIEASTPRREEPVGQRAAQYCDHSYWTTSGSVCPIPMEGRSTPRR